MNRRDFMLGASTIALAVGSAGAFAQEAAAPPLEAFPRDRTLIVHNPEPTIRNPGWFNVWVNGGGGASTGLHQLVTDTLWFIDPDAGIEGKSEGATYNSLAAGPPQYNADFTEMTVALREGLLWSDGTPFSADDVVYTVQKHMETPGMVWSGAFSTQVAEVSAPDAHTVHFRLQGPNSRFHALFSVRWNAAWIMPKHVFEQVEDVLSYDFNPPVSIGPYTLNSFDPNGTWYIWDKRPDWDRTAFAQVGEPVPEHVIYRNNVAIDSRLIEMRNGNLDMIHDLSPEGTFSILAEDPQVQGWFPSFPYAHPDPTLVMAVFNLQNEKFADPRVRWALALMLDARAMSMASYRGAATLSAISVPPTGTHPRDYHAPMQQALIDYELDTGTSVIKPYDPDVGVQIAEMVRAQEGDVVPTDPEAIRNSFGYGWWRQNLQAAEELLTAAGYTRSGNQWLLPSGEPFTISVVIPAEGVVNRLGTIIAQLWSQAGVQSTPEVATDIWDRTFAGSFEVEIGWAVETWGGHPDLSYFLDSYHSEYVAEPGAVQSPRNWMRWSNPELDAIIEEMRGIDFNDPRVVELGREFVMLHLSQMPNIPIMAYNVFSVQSNRHWTGWPNSERPYANPVTNWANSRYILTQIRPATA